MPSPDDGAVRITLRDVYDEVKSLRQEVATIKDAVPDHESRIRVLERWSYAIPSGFILALASALVAILKK